MKRTLPIALTCLMALASCVHHDDFDFAGIVVDYELCNGMSEIGYAIDLSSPDSIGGTYTTRTQETYGNVVVVYGADRMLHEDDKVSGRIYLDPHHSKTECNYHYTDRDVPEAVFTKLKKE